MKKAILLLTLFVSIQVTQAQVKVELGGNVILCKPTNPSNTVMIGSTSPLYSAGKLQIKNYSLPSLVLETWHAENIHGDSISEFTGKYDFKSDRLEGYFKTWYNMYCHCRFAGIDAQYIHPVSTYK